MLQDNVAAALDGVSAQRVKIESISAGSLVVAFYIEDDMATGALSGNDAATQLLAMDTSALQNTFPGFAGLEAAPVSRLGTF